MKLSEFVRDERRAKETNKTSRRAAACAPYLLEHLAHHAVVWLRACLHGQDETARVGGVMEDAAKQNIQTAEKTKQTSRG